MMLICRLYFVCVRQINVLSIYLSIYSFKAGSSVEI